MANPHARGSAPPDRAPAETNVAMGIPDILESVVRATHIAARAKEEARTEWKRDILARLPVAPSNYGASCKKKGDSRKSRLYVSELAIGKNPYLRRKKEGQWRQNAPTWRYMLRPVDINVRDEILRSVAKKHGGDVIDIFGDWSVWREDWGRIIPPHAPKDARRQPNRREEWAAGDLVVEEIANMTALRAYAESGVGRRRAQLLDFIKYHEEIGGVGEDGRSRLQQVYTKKLIAGVPFGRRYAGKSLCII